MSRKRGTCSTSRSRRDRSVATPADRRPISICLSGGGFRATCFGAGALLAVLRSTARDRIRSVSSVSGGSVASALFLGTAGDDPDLRHRARLVGGLVTGDHIGTQARLRSLKAPVVVALGSVVAANCVLRDIDRGFADIFRWSAIYFVIVGLIVVVAAVWESAYAVQSVIEALVRSTRTREGGAIRHVFCATDLGSGEHAYLTDQQMLRVQGSSTLHDVPVADTVAASAGFPGFRPVILGPHQVGGLRAGPRAPIGPVARALIGTVGLMAIAEVLTITVLRMLDALSGTQGLVIWTVGVLAGSALAVGSALLLRTQPNFVYLVDGGVCDNLGPAFAYLTRDDRYAGLGELLYGPTRPDDGPETLLIVVDASKSVDTNYFARTLSPLAAMIPLRFRILMRSGVQLVASSNSSARRRAVQKLIDIDETVDGSILSLSELPDGPLSSGRDWTEIAAANRTVPTTLSRIESRTASDLMMHGYELMADYLSSLGTTVERPGPEYFDDLTGTEAQAATTSAIGHRPRGRFGRRQDGLNRLFWIVFGAVSLAYALIIVRLIVASPPS